MAIQQNFYTEMRSAIRHNLDLADVSPEVWQEFCAAVTPEHHLEQPPEPNRIPAPAAAGTPKLDPKPSLQHNTITPSSPPEKTESPVASTPASMPDLTLFSWDELENAGKNCRACQLRSGCQNVVFGEGNQHAELMFIGEGPGADEDAQGRPFVGAAGQLLDKMILAMQYQRHEVYIANVVKCRPPGNRAPEEAEANCCMKFLTRQIELTAPKVIVLLGATPLRYLMQLTGIKRHRGTFLEYKNIPVMPTFHPAYLLRSPEDKRLVWADLKQVMTLLGKELPKR